jgi:hypothetical protein
MRAPAAAGRSLAPASAAAHRAAGRPAAPAAPPCRRTRRVTRHAAPPPGGDAGSDAAARSDGGEDASPSSTGAPDSYTASLSDLWRNDFFFMDARGRQDTEKAFNGVAFGHELLVAAFGKGERPALQQELQRLKGELEAARQQARAALLRHCCAVRVRCGAAT